MQDQCGESVETINDESSATGGAEGQGGYLAVLHTLEEKFYGPDSPMDAKSKILLYIRHRTLREWTKRKAIPKSEIMAATGLQKRVIEKALSQLDKTEHLLVHRSKSGKVWNDNQYELHPKRYGSDFIYRKPGQPFAVIEGGNQGQVVPNTSVHLPPNNTTGYRKALRHKHPQEPQQEPLPGRLKNPLKEPLKNSLKEKAERIGKIKDQERKIDPKNWQEVKAFWLRKYPKDGRRLEGAFAYLGESGSKDYPSAYILTAWEGIRDDFAHFDPQIPKEWKEEAPRTVEDAREVSANIRSILGNIRGMPR